MWDNGFLYFSNNIYLICNVVSNSYLLHWVPLALNSFVHLFIFLNFHTSGNRKLFIIACHCWSCKFNSNKCLLEWIIFFMVLECEHYGRSRQLIINNFLQTDITDSIFRWSGFDNMNRLQRFEWRWSWNNINFLQSQQRYSLWNLRNEMMIDNGTWVSKRNATHTTFNVILFRIFLKEAIGLPFKSLNILQFLPLIM